MASTCEAWGNPLCWSVSLFKADLLHWNERSGEAHNVQRVCVYLYYMRSCIQLDYSDYVSCTVLLPVLPQEAVAEVSRIGNL